MLGACTPKQSRRFFSQEAAAFCCIGFPFGGSWHGGAVTDEGAGPGRFSRRRHLISHLLCKCHLPLKGKALVWCRLSKASLWGEAVAAGD